jgi:hypothetical protein
MQANYKGSDKEGRIRLGHEYANKQWQITALENGSIVLVPMVPATNEDVMVAFNEAFTNHKKTIDALK